MNYEIIKEALLILAVWRLTSLLFREDGPFDIFLKLRSFIGVYYDEYSQPRGRNVVALAFTCFWCLSMWIALAAVLFANNSANIRWFVIEWFAVSAGAIFIDEVIERLGKNV